MSNLPDDVFFSVSCPFPSKSFLYLGSSPSLEAREFSDNTPETDSLFCSVEGVLVVQIGLHFD